MPFVCSFCIIEGENTAILVQHSWHELEEDSLHGIFVGVGESVQGGQPELTLVAGVYLRLLDEDGHIFLKLAGSGEVADE